MSTCICRNSDRYRAKCCLHICLPYCLLSSCMPRIMRHGSLFIFVVAVVIAGVPCAALEFLSDTAIQKDLQAPLLTAFVTDITPWDNIIANSDQVQPVYLGSTPREIEFGSSPFS